MDIGTEKPAIIVEPVEDPFRHDEPAETPPAPVPDAEPVPAAAFDERHVASVAPSAPRQQPTGEERKEPSDA